MKSFGALSAVLIGAVTIATAALGQHWPTRPITVVSPFVAGTTDDLVAQVVLGPVGQQIGQPFVLENRPGGDGTAGVASVVNANPDGNTLLLSSSAMSAAVILHKVLPYDPLHDLAPIAMFGGEPSMLVAAPGRAIPRWLISWRRPKPSPARSNSRPSASDPPHTSPLSGFVWRRT